MLLQGRGNKKIINTARTVTETVLFLLVFLTWVFVCLFVCFLILFKLELSEALVGAFRFGKQLRIHTPPPPNPALTTINNGK